MKVKYTPEGDLMTKGWALIENIKKIIMVNRNDVRVIITQKEEGILPRIQIKEKER